MMEVIFRNTVEVDGIKSVSEVTVQDTDLHLRNHEGSVILAKAISETTFRPFITFPGVVLSQMVAGEPIPAPTQVPVESGKPKRKKAAVN